MSNTGPIRIPAEPESPEQAAQMIANQKDGAWELVGGAVIGLPTETSIASWPFMWPDPTRGGPAALTTAVAAYQEPDGSPRADVAIATQWTALHFGPPYIAALVRLAISFVGLPIPPAPLAFWVDATQHSRLLQHLVDQQRLLIFATKPPIAALSDPAVLGELPGLGLEFDQGLEIVRELLDQMAW